MLTNTVGIMLFILAFTVLASGGAVIAMRLPLERKTKNKPIYFVCWNQKVLPLDGDLTGKITDPLGKPTYSTADSWVRSFNNARAEDDFFVVTGQGQTRYSYGFQNQVSFVLAAKYEPKPNAGETTNQLRSASSRFQSILSTNRGKERFAYFMVYPDCIDTYRAARHVAAEMFQIGSGWGPLASNQPIRFSLAGGGGGGIIPDEQ